MSRKLNFFAGPSVLPMEVLDTLDKEIKDYRGNGQSMIETSHRGQCLLKCIKNVKIHLENY